MKNKLLIIYFICLCLYFMQGGLYEHGGIVTRTTLVCVLLLDLYYILYAFTNRIIDVVGKCILFFILLRSLYWFFSPKIVSSFQIVTFGELKNSFLVLLSYFPFSVWSCQGRINNDSMKWIVPLTFVSVVIAFYIGQREAMMAQYWRENVTNNVGYYFVSFLPFLGFIFNKKYSWALLGVSIFLCLFGAKRGAILCIAIESLLFLHYKWNDIKRKKRFFAMFGITIIVSVAAVYFYNYIINNSFLIERFNSDSSGRDDILSNSIIVLQNSSVLNLIFGYGFCQTWNLLGITAHNDWIESIINMGLIGLFAFLVLTIRMYKTYKEKRIYLDNQYRFVFEASFISFIIRSFLSQCVTAPEVVFLIIVIAIVLNKPNELCQKY